MTELEELRLAYADCARQRNELLVKLKQLAKPEPEPVAWASKRALARIKDFDSTIYANGGFDDAVPLYTSAPTPPITDAWRESASDYERGVIDGMSKQAERSVDRAVNAISRKPLTDEEVDRLLERHAGGADWSEAEYRSAYALARAIEAKIKEQEHE